MTYVVFVRITAKGDTRPVTPPSRPSGPLRCERSVQPDTARAAALPRPPARCRCGAPGWRGLRGPPVPYPLGPAMPPHYLAATDLQTSLVTALVDAKIARLTLLCRIRLGAFGRCRRRGRTLKKQSGCRRGVGAAKVYQFGLQMDEGSRLVWARGPPLRAPRAPRDVR